MNISLQSDNDTPGRFFGRKCRRYALDEMLTPSEKQCTQRHIRLNSKKTQQKRSLYFQNMIKAQNKRMFITTFIKKLKRTIVRDTPIDHQTLYMHQKSKKYVNGLHIPLNFEIFFSLISILQICSLLTIVSFSFVFDSVYQSSLYILTVAFGLSFHLIDIIKSIISVKSQDGKRYDKIDDITIIYLENQGLQDFLLLIAYIIQLGFHGQIITSITCYIFLLKIIPLLKRLNFLQHTIVQNIYWQQVWALIKLFFINYIFAHFLALILIRMAHSNHQQNWMKYKGIYLKPEFDQYIWAYYWAVTIMLTVGFGDLTPSSTQQAFCMIFIQTISCILLAYNITNVGIIINKIRSYSTIQQTNLKIFRNLIQNNKQIPSQLTHRITNYIKESVQMKRNSNIEQQNKFIQLLPNSFRQDLLKQCNKKIWTQLLFFKNLSDKILLQLSIKIQKQLSHPQQFIHRRKQQLDVMIFNSGEIAYTYYRPSSRALFSNGKVVQKFRINKDQFKLMSLDFLFNSFFPFNVKCLDYTVMYKMNQKALIQVLKDNPYDYEYFCMMKDKDKLLLNEFQIYKCQICQKQKHYLDKCPQLHYIPLRQHIVNKFLSHNISQQLMIRLKNPRISKTFYKTFTDRRTIKEDLLRKRVEQRDYQNRIHISLGRKPTLAAPQIRVQEGIQSDNYMRGNSTIDNYLDDDQKMQLYTLTQQQSVYLQAAQKFKDQMSKVINLQQNKQMMWDIESDLIQDFKYYFKKFNPDKINISLKRKERRKRRKAKGGSLRSIF